MPAEELLFEPTPAFGRYKPFLEHAVSHPAKANTKLLEFLVEKFTEEGDTVLDPMAGSGSTGVVAALRGRNAVQVELEPKYYEWMEKARENVEKHPTLTPKGWIKNICGDARRLSELLSQSDVAITSPPYTNSFAENPNMVQLQERGWVHGDFAKYFPQNLPLGNISAIITSPPYLDVDNVKPKSEEFWRNAHNAGKRWGSKPPAGTDQKQASSPENISNLPLGNVDAIITSPPYADAKRGGHADREKMAERWDEAFKEKGEAWNSWGKTWKTPGRLRGLEALGSGYSESQDNIGNLPFVDTVITSPPYERQLHDSREKRAAGAWKNSELDVEKNLPMGYSENPENIGNLRKETYLEAMLKVYGEMYKVLKPGGRAIVIVKPFIRNKRVVDLPLHTFLLMSRVGFVLEKVYKLRLRQQSFWRILYSRKYPDTPKISHEYVLVCMKPL